MTGEHNRLLSDGTYNYSYDNEGNRTRRIKIATGEITEYGWDTRNRMTSVVTKASGGSVIKAVEYTYDVYDRRIAKSVDGDGSGPVSAKAERFVYDGEHIALVFDGAGNQTSRYLHGPQIDQVLAEEPADGEVRWALSDHQGNVRDVVDSDGNVLNHLTYDSYGQVTSETHPEVDFRFGYTGRERDEETGLYYYRARYFDPAVGTFVSEDPLGFGAGDANVYRYVFNSPTNYTDPSGEIVPLVIAAGAALAPLVPIATGAIIGGGFDLGVQGVQIWRGNRDHLDWGSIGISTAGGALSGGLGSFAVSATSTVVNQTIGIAGRALINGVGSALVGGYTQFVRNAINDICLGNGVLSAAGWNGVFGTAASVIPDVIYQPPTTIFRINRSQVNYYRGREVPATYIESTLGPRYPSVTPETTSYPVNNAIAVSAGHLVNNATTLTPLTEN